MNENIALIAQRIRDLRDILEISAQEMAEARNERRGIPFL